MPDIEMLQIMSKTFDVSINELLAGQRLTNEEYRKKTDENIITVAKESVFSKDEKKSYWIRKWRTDHVALLIILYLIVLAAAVLPVVFRRPTFCSLSPIIGVIAYVWQNNRMMAYVEDRMYGIAS